MVHFVGAVRRATDVGVVGPGPWALRSVGPPIPFTHLRCWAAPRERGRGPPPPSAFTWVARRPAVAARAAATAAAVGGAPFRRLPRALGLRALGLRGHAPHRPADGPPQAPAPPGAARRRLRPGRRCWGTCPSGPLPAQGGGPASARRRSACRGSDGAGRLDYELKCTYLVQELRPQRDIIFNNLDWLRTRGFYFLRQHSSNGEADPGPWTKTWPSKSSASPPAKNTSLGIKYDVSRQGGTLPNGKPWYNCKPNLGESNSFGYSIVQNKVLEVMRGQPTAAWSVAVVITKARTSSPASPRPSSIRTASW